MYLISQSTLHLYCNIYQQSVICLLLKQLLLFFFNNVTDFLDTGKKKNKKKTITLSCINALEFERIDITS